MHDISRKQIIRLSLNRALNFPDPEISTRELIAEPWDGGVLNLVTPKFKIQRMIFANCMRLRTPHSLDMYIVCQYVCVFVSVLIFGLFTSLTFLPRHLLSY